MWTLVAGVTEAECMCVLTISALHEDGELIPEGPTATNYTVAYNIFWD
jgi:hypothetical protein